MGFSRPRVSTDAINIVIHSHSIGEGLGTLVKSALETLRTAAGFSYTVTVTESVTGNADYTGGSFDGFDSPSLLSAFAGDVDAHWESGQDNRVVTMGGLVAINDLNRNAAQAYANLDTYVAGAKVIRAGWRICPCTIVDCIEYDAINPHPTRGDLEDDRDAFDDLLLAGVYAARVVNFRTSSTLHKTRLYITTAPRPPGGNAAYTSAFSDGIHLDTTGKAAAAAVIAAKMFAL